MKKVLLLVVLFTTSFVFAGNTESKKVTNSTAYKDGKEAVTTVYNDIKESAPKVFQALEVLAKELKTTTESLWGILVKQQEVWSWCFLILTISSLINWYLFYKRNISPKIEYVTLKRSMVGQIPNDEFKEYVKSDNDPRSKTTKLGVIEDAEEEYLCPKETPVSGIRMVTQLIHLALCLILSYYSFIHFADMLTGFINPEFGALKTITTVVQSFK